MNKKEAIEFINKYSGWDMNVRDKREQTIELLQRGEKYEKMWVKLRDIYLPNPEVDDGLLKRLMDAIEQKYFPKEE